VSAPLAALRRNLDLMSSPVPDQPGLLIRDPFGYAQGMLIIPPPLVPCLLLFDGSRSELDLREALVRITGDIQVGRLVRHLVDTLDGGGFLESAAFEQARAARHRAFEAALVREPAHAGSAYPDAPGPARDTLAGYLNGQAGAVAPDGLIGIAAPHVSPAGGFASYAAAYSRLGPHLRDRTFVILGTSHYGAPDTFGLTRKPFRTPLGETRVDAAFIDALAAAARGSVAMEDYCHAVEHSIEFQVLFLQHVVAPDVKIVPILCGAFAASLAGGGVPEKDERVHRFFEALAEIAGRERARLFWILGIDMAHIGRRYGDRFDARAEAGRMTQVAERDKERLARVAAGDPHGFWELVREKADDLRWCGSSPLYTFLKAVVPGSGELLRYEQWNIDDASVVSFAGLAFRA
jgi:AmmeMemoRadiSam system protein B